MNRVLIVGTSPNSRVWEPGRPALVGSRSAERIAALAGSPPLEEWADTTNLCEDPEHYDHRRAQEAVLYLLSRCEHRRIVFLGTPARDALRASWFEWNVLGVGRPEDKVYACSPHPSGLSRFWNDPANYAAGKKFWEGVYDARETR